MGSYTGECVTQGTGHCRDGQNIARRPHPAHQLILSSPQVDSGFSSGFCWHRRGRKSNPTCPAPHSKLHLGTLHLGTSNSSSGFRWSCEGHSARASLAPNGSSHLLSHHTSPLPGQCCLVYDSHPRGMYDKYTCIYIYVSVCVHVCVCILRLKASSHTKGLMANPKVGPGSPRVTQVLHRFAASTVTVRFERFACYWPRITQGLRLLYEHSCCIVLYDRALFVQ